MQISELKVLYLESIPELRVIWHDSSHIPDFSFSELTTLEVNDCQFLSDAVLPFHLLPLLPKLKSLVVKDCDNAVLRMSKKDCCITTYLFGYQNYY